MAEENWRQQHIESLELPIALRALDLLIVLLGQQSAQLLYPIVYVVPSASFN